MSYILYILRVPVCLGQDDTCDKIIALFTSARHGTTLRKATIEALNGVGSCDNLVSHHTICVDNGSRAVVPVCAGYLETAAGDTCATIIADGTDAFSFFDLNPGLDCSLLTRNIGVEVSFPETAPLCILAFLLLSIGSAEKVRSAI